MNIGKSIRELRKQQGRSQVELAGAAGIMQATLSQIENSSKRPGPDTLKKLAKALDVPVSLIYALGMEKEDVPKEKQKLYDQLFPLIQTLILQLGSKK